MNRQGKGGAATDIDIVVTWVDGNDPAWRARKAQVTGEGVSDDREDRYRDWDLMRYWFRGIERFAPWARKVFFVCGQEPPAWLDPACGKLEIVRHEDFIPERFLPTFSSHPIELNMHRIPGLGELFIYFNDDMFLTAPVREERFFRMSLPRDSALLNPVPTMDLAGKTDARIFTIPLNNVSYINRDYAFRACVKTHPLKWLNARYGKSFLRNLMLMSWPRFVGFDEPHLPQAYLKSSFEKAWEEDGDILEETCSHAIRNDRDVNPWMIRERQLAEGCFVPVKPVRDAVFDLGKNAEGAAAAIRGQQKPMVCLEDGPMDRERFEQIRALLRAAFEEILPGRSMFEKEGSGEA